MRKRVRVFRAVLLSGLFLSLASCEQNTAATESRKTAVVERSVSAQQSTAGAIWLSGIFRCATSLGYCLPDYEQVFTPRYLEFYQDVLQVFEYPEAETDEQRRAAEQAHAQKWTGIYPLVQTQWPPFGMGNGMAAGDTLVDVKIIPVVDLRYSVLIDYGEQTLFANEVRLIPVDAAFLIDHIDTHLVE